MVIAITEKGKQMARYIDADALIDSLGVEDRDLYCKLTIEDAPTADVKPIVRCKECIWWRDEDCTNPIGMFLPEEDSFCSCATRRKENG